MAIYPRCCKEFFVFKQAVPYLLATLASLSSASIIAGEFNVACSYRNSNLDHCADVISDLVTDKFIAHYPAKRFQIFVHSNIYKFTDGGFSSFAIAGVVPLNSGEFPIARYSSTNANSSNEQFSGLQLADFELKTYRQAVTTLMEECELSPTCDVYTAR